MANDSESDNSVKKEAAPGNNSGWLRIAVLTAASAVAGGLATAWFYRKTLARLRETEENAQNPHFGITGAERPADQGGEDEDY